MAADEAVKTEVAQSQEPESERERSTIVFPYGDLEDAYSIAKAVHTVGGSTCEWDQVAAHLGQSPGGGGFRQKMITAKIFGVVTYSQGKVSLTPLGGRLCDPKQEKMAKAEAFLAVPLYRAIYDKFKGIALPQASALEAEMVTLGVGKNVKDKARQVFQRSANQAGFFWSGPDRLVMPAKGNAPIEASDPTEDHDGGEESSEKNQRRNSGGNGGGGSRHPLIEGLMGELPAPKTPWPLEAQKNWLQLASSLFKVSYESPDDGRATLRIEVQKDSSK
jgi:hypothetical protein